jgi:hypothetical protein
MEIVPTNYTVLDYCKELLSKQIQVNRDYQRSDTVWPEAARSFLIETIVLGYPVPKLSLFQKVDVRSKTAFKEIVDGQQRSGAVLAFDRDELRLTRGLETDGVAGRTYSELDEQYQSRFLNYRLALDLFVGATPETIREVFRRTNSYTVPLNPEEERHATYQGAFKWFIYKTVSREHHGSAPLK